MAVLAFSKVKDGRIGEGIVIGWGVGLYNVSDLERRYPPRQLDDRILGRYTYYLAWLYNHLGRTESKVYACATAKCINWLKD